MSAVLTVNQRNIELDGFRIEPTRRHALPGHEGYFFQVHPANPGEWRQTAYVLRILRGRTLVRSERISVGYESIKLELTPNEEPAFLLSPVYARLQQLGVERGLIHQVCDGWVYTPMFLRGTVHGRTDGTKEFIEDSSSGDSFMFDDASWAVVRHNDSRQIRAIYLWDHAAERDLTELYRLVAEPTR